MDKINKDNNLKSMDKIDKDNLKYVVGGQSNSQNTPQNTYDPSEQPLIFGTFEHQCGLCGRWIPKIGGCCPDCQRLADDFSAGKISQEEFQKERERRWKQLHLN